MGGGPAPEAGERVEPEPIAETAGRAPQCQEEKRKGERPAREPTIDVWGGEGVRGVTFVATLLWRLGNTRTPHGCCRPTYRDSPAVRMRLARVCSARAADREQQANDREEREHHGGTAKTRGHSKRGPRHLKVLRIAKAVTGC